MAKYKWTPQNEWFHEPANTHPTTMTRASTSTTSAAAAATAAEKNTMFTKIHLKFVCARSANIAIYFVWISTTIRDK